MISALSSRNVSKCQFLTGKNIIPEKYLLEHAAIKGLKYIPIEKELKKQTSVVEKEHQGLNKLFQSHKKEEEAVK